MSDGKPLTMPPYLGEDREAIYDAEIVPLMDKVSEICRTKGIPYVAGFQYAENGMATFAAIPVGSTLRLAAASGVLQGQIEINFEDDDTDGSLKS